MILTEPPLRLQPMVEFLTIRPSLLLPKLVSQVADAQGVEHGDPLSSEAKPEPFRLSARADSWQGAKCSN
jgi:hypothetical protein